MTIYSFWFEYLPLKAKNYYFPTSTTFNKLLIDSKKVYKMEDFKNNQIKGEKEVWVMW